MREHGMCQGSCLRAQVNTETSTRSQEFFFCSVYSLGFMLNSMGKHLMV